MTTITAKLLVAPPTRKIRYLQPPILNVPRTKPRATAPEVRRITLPRTSVNKGIRKGPDKRAGVLTHRLSVITCSYLPFYEQAEPPP